MRYFFSLAFILLTGTLAAQTDTSVQHPLTFSGYAEIYYVYDFNKPANNSLPSFIYNYTRANEVNLDLAYLKASYNTGKVRANIALATGTYMNANYSSEPGVLKNIYEADMGIKISKKQNLWIDAGIMPSHIGFEVAEGKDNWTLTRSIGGENSPYFETGIKLGYTSQNNQWYLAALYLNGWQRIQRTAGNHTPALGTQITFTPSQNVTLNYSTFVGNDYPDSAQRRRYFQDVYGIINLNDHWGIAAGIDYGLEQKSKGSQHYYSWYAPVIIIRYQPSGKISFAARAEYYSDVHDIIISTSSPNGFTTYGYSVNGDYRIKGNMLWRVEIRQLKSRNDIFIKEANIPVNQEIFISTSLAISF